MGDGPTLRTTPEVLAKAARAGRMRDAAMQAWREARRAPRRSSKVLRGVVRMNRSLHSRERRLVQEGLFAMVRRSRGIEAIVNSDAPIAMWLGWLVLEGLDPDVAEAEFPGHWHRFTAAWRALGEGEAPAVRLALRHSISDDLARRIVGSLGAEEAEAFLVAGDRRGPVALRANRLKCDRDTLKARLLEEGVDTDLSKQVADALRVRGRHNLQALGSFRDGWFEVQDEGSQRLAALVEPDGPVIDFCAGAGGKALALAALGVPVLALDVRGGALEELRRRARRAGAEVDAVKIPASGVLPAQIAQRRASRVLVDAPCTGSGTLRRHPEHRWLIDANAVAEKVALQQAILKRAATLVSTGGRLIYGTCSVLREENEAVVDHFLETHPGWTATGEVLHCTPHEDDTDAFYGAMLAAP